MLCVLADVEMVRLRWNAVYFIEYFINRVSSEFAGIMLLNLNCPLKWINDFSNQSLKRAI